MPTGGLCKGRQRPCKPSCHARPAFGREHGLRRTCRRRACTPLRSQMIMTLNDSLVSLVSAANQSLVFRCTFCICTEFETHQSARKCETCPCHSPAGIQRLPHPSRATCKCGSLVFQPLLETSYPVPAQPRTRPGCLPGASRSSWARNETPGRWKHRPGRRWTNTILGCLPGLSHGQHASQKRGPWPPVGPAREMAGHCNLKS